MHSDFYDLLFLFSSLQMIQNSDHWERLIIWTPKLERERNKK